MNKRKFTWDSWDIDEDGNCYVIDEVLCPNKDSVLRFICAEDNLTYDDRVGRVENDILNGWCKYSVGYDDCGTRVSGYQATLYESDTMKNGKRKQGWFPVWIVRKGEWY